MVGKWFRTCQNNKTEKAKLTFHEIVLSINYIFIYNQIYFFHHRIFCNSVKINKKYGLFSRRGLNKVKVILKGAVV